MAVADIFDIPAPDPIELELNYYWDTNDNNETGLSFYTITDSFIQLSAAYTAISTETSETSVDSNKSYLLVGSDPYQQLSATLNLEQWRASETLEIDATEATFSINLENFSISLSPRTRSITLFTIPGAPKDRFELSSQDLKLGLQYFGIDNWLFSVDIQKNSYSRNLKLAQIRPIILFYLQPSALSLASGFEDKRTNLLISHLFPGYELSLIATESISAADDSRLNSISLEWQSRLSETISLSLSSGQSKVSVSNTKSEFYNISITYYFY